MHFKSPNLDLFVSLLVQQTTNLTIFDINYWWHHFRTGPWVGMLLRVTVWRVIMQAVTRGCHAVTLTLVLVMTLV